MARGQARGVISFELQAANRNVHGRRRESHKLYQRAAEMALRRGLWDTASYFDEVDAGADALAGETTKARKAFQDFFELWMDADRDLPILKQAKAEYAKLQ